MSNPTLSAQQLEVARQILDELRNKMDLICAGDEDYLFALRRKVAKELGYDERSTPAERNRIKAVKRFQQNNMCAKCGEQLPDKYTHLHRLEAKKGYTVENTQLLHDTCHTAAQAQNNYK